MIRTRSLVVEGELAKQEVQLVEIGLGPLEVHAVIGVDLLRHATSSLLSDQT